jgi:putative flippase GtrA
VIHPLAKQVLKFASVGSVATALHVCTALVLNSGFNVSALTANFYAFIVSSIFSYFGNWLWTFESQGSARDTLPRFVVLNVACFAVNQAIVYTIVEQAHLPLVVALLPVVMIIPVASFWMSKTKIFINLATK